MPEHESHLGRAPQHPRRPAPPADVRATPWDPITKLGTDIGNRNLTEFLQRSTVQRQPHPPRTPIEHYDAEVASATPNWPEAAMYLNGCSREHILNRLAARSVADVRLLHDGAVNRAGVGPGSALALMTPHLLSDFAASFRAAAENVRKGDEALRLVREAEAAGVHFGGFAEDGPGHYTWAYTNSDRVYVPRARSDPILAMSDFLFELNNAIRRPAFAALDRQAIAGTMTARQFARENVAQEVEGMLRTAQVWLDTKRAMGGGRQLDRYDRENYVTHYREIEARRKTRSQLVDEVLRWRNGAEPSLTNEQFYMRQYRDMHPAPVDAGAPDAGGRDH